LYAATRAEVAKKLNATLKLHQDGLPMPPERLTVETYLKNWLAEIKNSVRPRTHQRYEQYVRLHAIPEIGKVKLTKLNPQHLQRLYAGRLDAGISPQTVVHLHRCLHTALKRAARFNLVQRNVADLLVAEDLPKVQRKEVKTFTPEQARHFLAAVREDHLQALYVVAITTGMRQGELLGLHWSDVDLAGGVATVRCSLQRTPENRLEIGETKTKDSVGTVQLTTLAVDALRRHKAGQAERRLRLGDRWDDQDLVFPNSKGRPINPTNLLRREFYPLLAEAKLPRIPFHGLRHSTATLLLGQGVPTRIVSDLLRHSDTKITENLYMHVTPTMQQQAVTAMDTLLGG
jgi:integrase